MRKEVLVSLGVINLMVSGNALAQTCTTAPSCEILGFNKTAADCEGKEALKCPFDQSKLYCPSGSGGLSEAAPGAIYYSDGTFSNSVIAGKTPVGVVAYVNGSNGFVVALEETSKTWGGQGSDVACLTNYSGSANAKTDMNGKTNTQCLLSDTKSHSAAEYCNSFKAVDSGKGSSGWYLPSAGEMYVMSLPYEAINIGLQRLSKTTISSNYYWSSSENDGDDAWIGLPSENYVGVPYGHHKGYSLQVRCVMAF